VSPAGWLPTDKEGYGTAIVDGGFVANSGAASASDAIEALHEAAVNLEMPQVLPVALMIANDPMPPHLRPGVPGPESRSAFAATTIGALFAPVMTLDRLRQLTTARAKHEYNARVVAAGGLVLDGFDLRDDGETYPLGWMLAPGTRTNMGSQIDKMANNSSSHFSVAAGSLKTECGINNAFVP